MNLRHLALVAGVVGGVVALAACPPSNTPQPVPPSPAPSPGYEPPPSPPPEGMPAIGAPAGAPCLASSECASGACEGQGCDAPGTCAPADRSCTKDLREYCGCDGATFRSSGSCPGARYARAGSCEVPPPPTCPGSAGCPAQPDGAACLVATDCASGVCEGLGCGRDAPGVCAPARRRCTKDRRAYCGCDGTTFYGSGSCPGRRFAAREACPNG